MMPADPPQNGPPHNIPELLAEFRREARRRRLRAYPLLCLMVVGMVGIAIWYARIAPEIPYNTGLEWTVRHLFAGVWAGAIVLGFVLALTSKKQKAVMHALIQQDNVSAIGPLLDTSKDVLDWNTPWAVIKALTLLLPRLRASDADLLTDKHLDRLCHSLSNSTFWLRQRRWNKIGADYLIAILKAMEQVGDHRALVPVERLANLKAKTAAEQRVKAAAQACLPALRQRVDRSGRMLLRPAGAPDTPAETLLRPASDAGDTDPQQLLRPSAPTGNQT